MFRNPCLLLASLIATATGAETVVEPAIERVDLFKNGLAVIRASFPVGGDGDYVWECPPRAVHGTFWIEGDLSVETRGSLRTVREVVAEEAATGDLQRDLEGREVVVVTEDGPSYEGTVWALPDEPPSRPAPSSPGANANPWQGLPPQPARQGTTGSFLVLETKAGERVMINRATIRRIDTKGPFAPEEKWVEKPSLHFRVAGGEAGEHRVRVSWLCHGLSWAPSYRVELGDGGTMVLEQSAIVRNERIDLKGTEIGLISGFPNVSFGQVDSPLWPEVSLAGFFSQIGQSAGPSGFALTQNITSNSISFPTYTSSLPDLSEPGASSDDLHIASIGARDLAAGETLSLQVARKEATYERVVEWTVPDSRDERGRYQRGMGQGADDGPWDAVMFHNPFDFPMTTAPAMIRDAGSFRGQTRSDWVNPGQSTCLKVTKALSVRADYGEIEEEGEREIVWIGGDDYQRTKVRGTLKLKNSRGNPVTLRIRTGFSGELIEADGDPAKSLRTEGVTSVNPRRELDWTLELGAGESTELGFRYSVLVDR